MGDRFVIYNSTGVLDTLISSWIEITVEDTMTGNKASGCGKTEEEAERCAWANLKKIQGPTPSGY